MPSPARRRFPPTAGRSSHPHVVPRPSSPSLPNSWPHRPASPEATRPITIRAAPRRLPHHVFSYCPHSYILREGPSDAAPTAIRPAGCKLKPDEFDLLHATGQTPVARQVMQRKAFDMLDKRVGAGVDFTHQLAVLRIAPAQVISDTVDDLDPAARRKVPRKVV